MTSYEQATQTDMFGVLQRRWWVRLSDGSGSYTWAPSIYAARRKAENVRGVSVADIRPAADPLTDREVSG